jgi:ABC-type uncharacterized transport system permease subunit
MKRGEIALALGLLACCALLPLLLAGGVSAVTGVLAGNQALVGLGLVLLFLGVAVWLTRSKAGKAMRRHG